MADAKQLKSYLVGLGFKVDAKQYRDFDSALVNAARSVKRETAHIGIDLVKWQIGIVGFFTTVSTAVLGTIAHVAQADQEYRLFGERMFISTQNARSLKIALDALGQPLEAIAFDPELHGRFLQLQKDQKEMSRGLGGDFETTMRGIRDVEFELTRMKVEFQFFVMGVAKNLSQMLFGDGDILKHLREINSWVITNIPIWSKQFAQYLVPVLKDTWRILKDVGLLLGVFANEFSNLVGTLSGDDSLRSASFNFDKFARAVATAVGWLASMLDYLLRIEAKFPLLEALGGAAAGAAAGSVIPGIGTGIGGLAGGIGGATLGFFGRINGPVTGDGSFRGSQADEARQAAKMAGERLGIDPSIIFAQWAHETNNFSNRGARELNNFAGIRLPGSTEYRSFKDASDFADYYSNLIQHRYKGALGAKSIDEFATGLHTGNIGSYFEDSLSNYEKGMKNHIGDYSRGSSTTHVSIGDINIMQPNASADEIANKVASRVADKQNKQNQRNLSQLQTVFQ